MPEKQENREADCLRTGSKCGLGCRSGSGKAHKLTGPGANAAVAHCAVRAAG